MAVASSLAGPVLAGPVLYGHFWNCACADNEIFALAHWAITHAHTTPWLANERHKIPEKPHHHYKFTKRTFGQKKAVSMPSNLLGLASSSGNDFTSWLSAR